jgi:superfamily II DNA helicase RecQ
MSQFCATDRHYHASLDQAEREQTQYDWTHGEVQVIVATVAFGMGRISFFMPFCAPVRW